MRSFAILCLMPVKNGASDLTAEIRARFSTIDLERFYCAFPNLWSPL